MKRECKYPGCWYYSDGAETYCCGACAFDHKDQIRLNKEAKNGKKKTNRRNEVSN